MNSLWLGFAAVAVAHAASSVPRAYGSLSPTDIMTKNEQTKRLRDSVADASISTTGADGVLHLKKFTWWRKLESDGSHYSTLTRFLEPAEVRGEGILFLEHGSDQNEVLLYLPAYKKIRRVESQSQSGSFMGSAFSYSDIATPHAEDYHYTLKGEDPCPDGGKCWQIESVPATDSVHERTGVSRAVSWIREDNFMDVKGESYDDSGKLYKQFAATDLREVDPAAHKWMAFHLEVKNLKASSSTTLQFANVKVNSGLPDATFTQASLSKE